MFPWGQISAVGGQLQKGELQDAVKTMGALGGPVVSVSAAITTGIDPFTEKPIWREKGTFGEKTADVLWYAYNMTVPGLMHTEHGAGTRFWQGMSGELDEKTGELKVTPKQGVARLFGQNIYSVDPADSRRKNIKLMKYDMQNILREMNKKIRGLRKQGATSEEIREVRNDYRKRIEEMREELNKYRKVSIVPSSMWRAS